MALRYLFGPVDAAFADQCLHAPRQRGDCVAFDLRDGADLTIGFADTWSDVSSRFPAGWQPDFVALYLPYRTIPPCLWSSPVPIVGLAADWNLLWHYYRRCLPGCDLVLTDTMGVETLARQGLGDVRVANLYGFERAYLESPLSAPERDIDVLFVGNFNAAVQRERLAWLGRLGGLAKRWRVLVTGGVFGDAYRALLARARIVFNRSIRGECNRRALEATASGALLFQEAGNREVAAYFQDRQEYVAYGCDDLEDLLGYYLEHEEERQNIAEAGRRRARDYSFGKLWDAAVEQVIEFVGLGSNKGSPLTLDGGARRGEGGECRPAAGTDALLMRSWQLLQSSPGADSHLAEDLQQALAADPRCAAGHHALAATLAHAAARNPGTDRAAIVNALREALHHDPTHVMASLNLAEVFVELGQKEQAVEQARQALAVLERNRCLSPNVLDAPHLPPVFDYFRVEWERAAWSHAGQPAEEALAKLALLRWRIHTLLANLNGEVTHHYEAALARPDLPTSRAALGCALARAGKFTEAVAHLAQAAADNPFDVAAARAYFGVLGERGDRIGQRLLSGQRRLLAEAAPNLVAKEAWFMETPPLGDELASLIILCCNQLDFTRQCLESVWQHTRPPYELLLIDNGSTDGTAAYLDELRQRSGPERVVVIRNDTNRGFAAGCNQGLTEARGRYLVLLNNDTIVTPGWLEGLIAVSHHNWPRIGIVGPMTSCASPPQEVPIDYRTPEELLAFANRRRQAFAGQASSVQRLIGFCMLFRREVWEKVGGLDEGFGLGFFEDDDLCVRVREAGFELAMALDVFIHHYGNQTFKGLDIDARAQLETNFQKFRAKWGDERCAGYKVRESPPAAAPMPVANELASLIVLCCNQLDYTRECLESVLQYTRQPYELVLIDNGSTDGTPGYVEELRQRQGPQRVVVIRNETNRGFAAGCNQGLQASCGRYLVLLNNDTIVTSGWLEGLITWSLRNWPRVGLVGPVTSFPPYQSVPVDYRSPEELQAFAAERRQTFAGQALQVQRLCGFCLLFRREVWEKLGGLDERFGLGNMEDDDLGVRAMEAGFDLVKALDVFIHHHGNRTFKGLGIDVQAQLRRNFEKFRAKWGEKHCARYRIVPKVPPAEMAPAGAATCMNALSKLYGDCCTTPSDINEHLPTLYRLACKCRHITELGTRTGVSTTALLFAQPQTLVCYDKVRLGAVERLESLSGRTHFTFHQADVAGVEIAETDLLFIDTWHVYSQLQKELKLHAGKARKYIVLHDTTTFGERGETEGHRGLWPAVEEFLAQGTFRLVERFENNNGLTVLERLAEEPVPDAIVFPAGEGTAPKPRVSLCIIVKNEEKHLAACLASVAGLVDEMIVIDTGSADRTKEIAQEAGAQVYDFSWVDSFAAARNESLRHATGDWILWLDADERLDETNRQRLRTLLASLKDDNLAYVMRQFSKLEAGTHAAAQVDQVRLFRNRPDIRWQYRVHEQILLAVRRSGGDVRLTDIVIDHAGFNDAEVQGPKVDRNLRLLELELAEHPNDAFVLYNLGAVRLTQGQSAEALDLLHRSLKHSEPSNGLVRKLHALIARANHQLGQKAEALTACRTGLATFPDDGELLFWEALLLREQKDLDGAAGRLQRVLQARPPQHFTSVDAGLYSYRARHFLAEVYRDQGRLDEAEAQWQTAVAECPSFTPAWLELAKLFCQTARWPQLADALTYVEGDPRLALEAPLLRGRACLARKEFTLAKEYLQAVIARAPKAVLPRVLLSHALLQEEQVWEAAQEALLDILILDPSNTEAQHNLRVLRREHPPPGTTDGAVSPSDAPVLPRVLPEAHAPPYTPPGQPVGEKIAFCSAPKVSLCMIVRNEEKNLADCLQSVADLVDEMIVVDTGSTDRTKDIALQHGAKVSEFQWIDHFAAARNESLRRAQGQWIFWLDADDRVDQENRAKLRALFSSLTDEPAGYVMKCLCLPDGNGVATAVDHLRLFRNHPLARWTFRVHEQILPSLRAIQAEVRWSDVVIQHTGYQDPSLRQNKLQRDLRLLQLELADQPDHPFTLFNLGSVHQELGRTAEALKMFQRSLDRSAPQDSIVRKLYATITQCHRALGQNAEALAACRAGLELFADDVELFFQEGVTRRESGDVDGAVNCWERCLKTPPGMHFASVNTGLRGHITRHNLAVAYNELRRLSDAEAQWHAALEERPDYEPAWRGLLALYLDQERWSDVEKMAREAEAQPRGEVGASVIYCRLHLARKDFSAARQILEDSIQRSPQTLEPRILLSHALLREGKDWQAAEGALRGILALDPHHKEATHNLAVLLRQRAGA